MTPPQRAQDADTGERRDHCTRRLRDMLDRRQIAALRIGIVAVDIAAEDKAALVGLGDIEMSGAEGDDMVDERFQSLR